MFADSFFLGSIPDRFANQLLFGPLESNSEFFTDDFKVFRRPALFALCRQGVSRAAQPTSSFSGSDHEKVETC
jgi:hypothetical protein